MSNHGMIDLDRYLQADATELAGLVRRGLADPAVLLELATQRHHETSERINAVVEWYDEPDPPTVTDDSALPGIPFLRKDYGSTESGRLVEMGSRLAAGVRATVTSPFFRALNTAGVQVVGRSAVPELIQHGTTESVAFGVTRNPWDLSLSSGGSSGGAAAAVAAGVVPLAHASDCAGSIRIPAAACGLVGLKPGRRRVPWPDGGWGGIAEEFVLTRSVRDCRLLLDVLGEGPYLPVPQAMTIALNTGHWKGGRVDAGVIEATEQAASVLESAGHRVVGIDSPIADERLMTTWNALFSRWVAHDVRELERLTRRVADETTLEPTTLLTVEEAERLTVDDITRAQIEQGRITNDLQDFLAGFDALLTPTLGRETIPLGWVGGSVTPLDLYLERNSDLFPFSYLFNVTGWASLALPHGTAAGGLPLSVQLSGPIGSEHRLLALGEIVSPGVRPPA